MRVDQRRRHLVKGQEKGRLLERHLWYHQQYVNDHQLTAAVKECVMERTDATHHVMGRIDATHVIEPTLSGPHTQ